MKQHSIAWMLLLIFMINIGLLGNMAILASQEADGEAFIFACKENRLGCQLLQMIQAGKFTEVDLEDSVSVKVYSAVYPLLTEITEDDFTHFEKEHDISDEAIRTQYYEAMAQCLSAELISAEEDGPESQTAAVREVLLLFLDCSAQENTEEQKNQIRDEMSEDILAILSDESGAPIDFIRWLIESRGR